MADGIPDFTNRNLTKLWLSEQPNKFSEIIAVRAALRVFPLISKGGAKLDDEFFSFAVAPIFRALMSPWLSNGLVRPFEADQVRAIAEYSAHYAQDVSGDFVSSVAANAAYAVANPEAASTNATSNTFDVANAAAAATAKVEGANVALAAAAADAAAYAGGSGVRDILELPIWFDGAKSSPPVWAIEAWNFLTKNLLERRDERWYVWTTWYQDRLDGRPVDWELERGRLQLPEVWEAGPKVLNEAILRRMEEIEAERRRDAAKQTLIDDAALGDIVLDAIRREMRIEPRPDEVPALAAPQSAADYAHKLEALSFSASDLAEDVTRDYPNIGRGFSTQLSRYAALLVGASPDALNPDRFFDLGQGVLDLHANPDIRDALPDEYRARFDRLASSHREFAQAFYAVVAARRAAVDGLPDPAEGDPAAMASEAAAIPAEIAEEIEALPPLRDEDRAWLRDLAEEVRERGVDLARLDAARQARERSALFRIVRRIVATVKNYLDEAETAAAKVSDATPEGVRHSLYASAAFDALKLLIAKLFQSGT